MAILRARRRGPIGVAWLLGACSVVPNPDYDLDGGDDGLAETSGGDDGPIASGIGSGLFTTTAHDTMDDTMGDIMDDTADDGGTESSTSGPFPEDPPSACGVDLDRAPGPCPAGCDTCEAGECELDCLGKDECKDATLVCPDGRPCRVACVGQNACSKATIACPAAHGCRVTCGDEHACEGLRLVCGAGTCTLQCGIGKEPCKDAEVWCGTGETTVTCASGPGEVTLHHEPASACECVQERSCLDSRTPPRDPDEREGAAADG